MPHPKETDCPTSITFDLTYRCNLSCKMCTAAVSGSEGKEQEINSTEIVKIYTDYKARFNIGKVRFLGGEPTLRPDLADIIAQISPTAMTEVHTNGLLISPEKATALVKAGLHKIKFSIDGMETHNDLLRGKGKFKKTIEGLDNLLQAKEALGKPNPDIRIGCVLTKKNLTDIEPLYLLGKERNIPVHFWPMVDLDTPARTSTFDGISMDNGRTMDPAIRKLTLSINEQRKAKILHRDVLRKHGDPAPSILELQATDLYNMLNSFYRDCTRSQDSLLIDPFGEAFPCEFLREYKYGKCHVDGVNVWTGEKRKKMRKAIRKGELSPCQECNHKNNYRDEPWFLNYYRAARLSASNTYFKIMGKRFSA